MLIFNSSKAITRMEAVIIIVVVVIAGIAGGAYYYLTLPPAKKEVKIGFSIAMTGLYAETALWYKQVYELWAKQVNEKGGLLGIPIRLIYYDDKSSADTGVELYEKLITVDQVDFVLPNYPSTTATPTTAVTEKYKMVWVDGGSVFNEFFGRGFKYLFSATTGVADDYAKGFCEYWKTLPPDQQPKTAAVIVSKLHGNMLIAIGCLRWIEALTTMKVVLYEEYEPDIKDFTAIIGKVKASGAEVLMANGFYPHQVLTVRTCKELNYNPKALWMIVAPQDPRWVDDLGPTGDYVLSPTLYDSSLSTPGNKEFVKAFMDMYNRVPDYHAGAGYSGCQILEAAIRATGSFDNTVIRDYLATHEYDTVIGHIKYDVRGVAVTSILPMIQVQKLKVEVVWPSELATAKMIYPKPPFS